MKFKKNMKITQSSLSALTKVLIQINMQYEIHTYTSNTAYFQ
jgi:hypothetical protein